ncbi:DtxR family iron (metal) dependent repressor [Desulfitobacterium sp. LBE]|uniref:HTH dtxR-type domain-containing protein n=6 Tax=root TaxID=1 RepID=Q24V34_DESHY|nr:MULTISPECIES: metal-dependent transcriptional regulator [Desulfitobacterium]ACL21475.1 iron (metal) dependent repressor, DtxR family [Desulfitobacterium hafniense DCB-2]EHL07622.1 iron dependent repressor, DNA binding domain protein [Desulfitobacterium hafniense DP7]KTE89850.1 DtxR family transcriptional regulator [Desulfitobacterium hafniense]MEA5023167.1 metal-dependent transcriptional regulator [Desulfitobacterium hafniense]TWH60738.1 DtxR family iron (metal) dependent repressor [Desulfi
MSIQESGEMYLETIYILQKKKGDIRSIDIAHELGYTKPSISRAVGILKKNDYIEVDSSGVITLTDEGEKIASRIYERHDILTRYLVYLGVDEETAAQDACRVEHVISQDSFEKMKEEYHRRMKEQS